MQITVTWPNSGHVLLRRASGGVRINAGGETPLSVANGRGTVAVTDPFPFTLSVRMQFEADLAPNPTVLGIIQEYEVVSDLRVFPRRFIVPDVDSPTPAPFEVTGQNPLLKTTPLPGKLTIEVTTRMVNVAAFIPNVVTTTGGPDFVSVANSSKVRTLAKTDGSPDPTFWITCAPKVCRRTAAGDILGFLTPPQGARPTDLTKQLTPGTDDSTGLTGRRAVFFGQGVDSISPTPAASDPRARFLDHFTPAAVGLPNFILARGWEQALFDSGRHVVLALPVPAGEAHHDAGGKKLAGMLQDVHRLLRAVGDITPPQGARLARPQLGVGGYSMASTPAFQAMAATPKAYSDVFLLEPTTIGSNIDIPGITSARICLIGFTGVSVGKPFDKYKRTPGLAGRVRIVPRNYPDDRPDKASIPTIVSRSSGSGPQLNPRALAHALTPLIRPPLLEWEPRDGHERFEMLHQYAAFGGDNEGTGQTPRHFLTQALLGSSFR